MLIRAALLALVPVTALAGGPTLDVSGSCPGVLSITASGFTPGGNVAVLTGVGTGSDMIPGGQCAGVVSSLRGIGNEIQGEVQLQDVLLSDLNEDASLNASRIKEPLASRAGCNFLGKIGCLEPF